MARLRQVLDGRAVLIEGEVFRPIIRRALGDFGIRPIGQFDSVPANPAGATDLVSADLVVAAVSDHDPSALRFVADIRWRRIACNPFVPIIITTPTPNDRMIRAIVNAGVDAVLVKPFAQGQVQAQIAQLIENRRPFVVTVDYIGPERRAQPAGRTSSAKYFKVPNSLLAKAAGATLPAGAVDRAWLEIQLEHTMRLGFQILFQLRLAERIEGKPVPEPVRQEASRVPGLVRTFAGRLAGAQHDAIRQRLAAALTASANQAPDRPIRTALETDILAALADYCLDGDTKPLSADVDRAVASYLARLEAPPEAKAG